MQNNVTYLSRKLQRSLDNNYNVIDMPAVIEIISSLEKTCVTKELLETTRLGKYINELRRKTSNDSLAKRAKELLKRWRDLILPDANGQIRSSSANSVANSIEPRSDSPCTPKSCTTTTTTTTKKRPASSTPPDNNRTNKKMLINGQNREFDFSDNSNCSIKELRKTDVIFINSDSNSSMPEATQHGDQFDVSNDATDNTDPSLGASSMQPKKRGRKKGSKNHKNLVIAAEESFTNKMAVSRNSKVKTTQELLADIQNRKPSTQDIELRAAQLTESLSRIEHKLNPQKQINKNVTPIRNDQKLTTHTKTTVAPQHRITTENWSSRSSPEPVLVASDDEIVDVVGTDPPPPPSSSSSSLLLLKPTMLAALKPVVPNISSSSSSSPALISEPLTIENLLSKLSPIDKSCLDEPDEIPLCECATPSVTDVTQQLEQERITVQIVGEAATTSIITQTTTSSSSLITPPAAAAATTTTTIIKESSSLFAPPSPLTFFSENTERLTPSTDIENDERTSTSDVFEFEAHCDEKTDATTKSVASCCEQAEEENVLCPAKLFLCEKYHTNLVDDEQRVAELHDHFLSNVNGNYGIKSIAPTTTTTTTIIETKQNDVDNIVPNYMYERLIKTPNENFQKYSISIDHLSGNNRIDLSSDKIRRNSKSCDSASEHINENDEDHDHHHHHRTGISKDLEVCDDEVRSATPAESTDNTDFREWHETLDVISYNDELLRILPYVIID